MSRSDVYMVHHLGGYGGEKQQISNEKAFIEKGFIRCRSEKGDDGKYWEVWMGYPWMLKGDLENAKAEDIERWILNHSVGNLDVCKVEKGWGLGVD